MGSLLYAAVQTRPDIAYAVGMLCRAMGKPTPELLLAATHVLCYLSRTRELGLCYTPDQSEAHGMSDADWAVKHSTTGYVFKFNSAAISWGSKKQDSISLSSCESEIMAASEAAKEAVYLAGYLDELDVPFSQPIAHQAHRTSSLLRARDGREHENTSPLREYRGQPRGLLHQASTCTSLRSHV